VALKVFVNIFGHFSLHGHTRSDFTTLRRLQVQESQTDAAHMWRIIASGVDPFLHKLTKPGDTSGLL
jgi:hypothetical protein